MRQVRSLGLYTNVDVDQVSDSCQYSRAVQKLHPIDGIGSVLGIALAAAKSWALTRSESSRTRTFPTLLRKSWKLSKER
jgi:hypothetical protein